MYPFYMYNIFHILVLNSYFAFFIPYYSQLCISCIIFNFHAETCFLTTILILENWRLFLGLVLFVTDTTLLVLRPALNEEAMSIGFYSSHYCNSPQWIMLTYQIIQFQDCAVQALNLGLSRDTEKLIPLLLDAGPPRCTRSSQNTLS